MQFAKEKCDCEWCDDKLWGTAKVVAAIATWKSVQLAQNSKEKPFFFTWDCTTFVGKNLYGRKRTLS